MEAEISWVEGDTAGWSWAEVDGAGWRWVEVDGAGWRWLHGLVIPYLSEHLDHTDIEKAC